MGVLCCSWKMELDMFKYRGFFFLMSLRVLNDGNVVNFIFS